MEARIDKDEWMDVWNSNTELQRRVENLEYKLFNLIQRIEELEKPVTIYGKKKGEGQN